MKPSRATLARIEAAPTQVTLASPAITASMLQSNCRPRRSGQRSPSTITWAGAQCRLSIARRMASIVACRMLIASISRRDRPSRGPRRHSVSRILSAEFFADFGREAFESAMPRICRRRSRMTAAATTGPASGPRPASSIPAVSPILRRSKRALEWIGARQVPARRCAATASSSSIASAARALASRRRAWCISVKAAIEVCPVRHARAARARPGRGFRAAPPLEVFWHQPAAGEQVWLCEMFCLDDLQIAQQPARQRARRGRRPPSGA